MSYQTNFTTYLTKKLSKTATTIYVQTLPTATSGRMEIHNGTSKEWIDYTNVAGSNPTGSLTGVTRDMSTTAIPSTGSWTGLAWPAGTPITIVVMHDQYEAGTWTVTSTSVVSANGFAGSVANASTTPAITLSTTINSPVLAGNWTAISAATTTGSGSTVVLSGSPALTTPSIAAITVSGGIVSLPTGATDTLVSKNSTDTLTNKRSQPRVVSATSYTTDTGSSLSVATCDLFIVTAQAWALKFNNPGGTPVQGEKLMIRIKDNGTARALTYDTQFRASSDLALPTTTVLNKTLYMGFVYNSTDTKWDLLAVLNNIT